MFLISLPCFAGGGEGLSSRVQKRLTLQTPANDELLHMLEQDFVELLKKSNNAEKLLDAEDLLAETNDNTHWTNYSAATRLLKLHRDLAAIPLLLRYMVLHTERSSSHVMLPAYRKTMITLTGHEIAPIYQSGPDLEKRVRAQVLNLFNDWWRKEKEHLKVDPAKMTPGQRERLVINLLKEVRYNGDFTGSGGARDTAYGAYHNVYYKVRAGGSSSDYPIDVPLHPSMIPLILAPSGYRADGDAVKGPKLFPYEAIHILAEFVKNGESATIAEIAGDKRQNSAVRMVCILALFRGGHSFQTAQMLGMLKSETDLERRLINLLSLRWAGSEAVPVLLDHMDDDSMEIATAAGCALADIRPNAALPKFEKLLDRHHVSMPLLLLGAMAEYKTPDSRALLKRLLTDAVEGRKNGQHLYRLISAFADGWEIPSSIYRATNRHETSSAKLALAHSEEMVLGWKAEKQRVEAAVTSLRTQLEVAEKIENLRRGEYKRLLLLQGDEIVTPEESKEAYANVKTIAAEVQAFRSKLTNRESELAALKERVGN